MAISSGDKLGPYQIIAPIGKGGGGEVYRAHDTKLSREVAIKTLSLEFERDADRMSRFEREARMLAALNHANIGAIYGFEESNGLRFLVLELVDGESLAQRIERDGRISPVEAATIASHVADALEAAHSKDVIHRDIKPGNIMITARGNVKVLDFGLAKQVSSAIADETRTVDPLTRAGAFLGTPHYMAPEVLRGRLADARSDIWALGVVLYAMLSGNVPFSGPTIAAICGAVLHDPLPPLASAIPVALRRVVEKALAKNPDDRYQTAGDIRRALEAIANRASSSRSTRRTWLWAAGGGAVVAAGGALWRYRHHAAPVRLLSTGGPASTNEEANELFELGIQFHRRQNDVPKGQAALERALAIDPNFAEALRYHAFGHLIQILNGYTNDTSLLYQAEKELKRAAQLDPNLISLPSAFTALYLMQGRRDLVPIDRLDGVIAQNPALIDSRLWRAILHWLDGENGEARQELTDMLKRDPVFGPGRMFLGETFRMDNDFGTAIREEKKVLELAPYNIAAIGWLSLALLGNGAVAQTRELLNDKRSAFEANYLWRSLWALMLAVEGRRDEALAAMNEGNLRFLGASFVVTLVAAEFFALMGDSEKALEWLDKAVRNGDERIEWFKRDPWLASIRSSPRFQSIVDSIESRRLERRAAHR